MTTVPLPPGLEAYDQTEAREDSYARVLLLGAGRTGKTTAVATTAPGPTLIINCDTKDATQPAAHHGGQFKAIYVTGRESFLKACMYAKTAAEAGEFKTIVIDTLTMLSDKLLYELNQKDYKIPYAKWDELYDIMYTGVVRMVCAAPAHVFALSHITPGQAHVGILPAIGGQAKTKLPQFFNDWVLFEVDTSKPKEERNFLVGPQNEWTAGGRSVRRSCKIPADVNALFAELGIKP